MSLYDQTLANPVQLRRVSPRAFDRILGGVRGGNYQVSVQENYAGARYIIERQDELRRTNLEQYGASKAVVVLCATTIEGVLGARRHLRRGLKSKQVNLGSLVSKYLTQRRIRSDLAASFFFLWFLRNMIHPEVMKRYRGLYIGLDLANFVYTITRRVLLELARVSRRRQKP